MSIEQWVNLPTEQKRKGDFVEGKVDKAKRVGPELRVIVEFKNDGLATFRWRVTRVDGTSYKPTEVGNNTRFAGFYRASSTNHEKKKIEDACDVTLPVAGGTKYKVEVKYKDKLVGTKEIESRRRIYYHPLVMASLRTGADKADAIFGEMETQLWNPDKKFYIEAVKKEGAGAVRSIPTIDRTLGSGPNSLNDLIAAAKQACGSTFKKFEPASIPIAICQAAARRKTKTFFFERTLPRPVSSSSPINEVIDLDLPGDSYLWKDLVPSDDKANGGRGTWFVDGMIMVSESEKLHHTCPIQRDQVFATGTKLGPYGGQSRVRVFADSKFLARHAGKKASISLEVWIVDGFVGGFSVGSINLITLMTEAYWAPLAEKVMKAVVLHEIGHKIGMVADGAKPYPEMPDAKLFYGDRGGNLIKGHRGPHCQKGMTYSKGAWSGKAKCVMFGSVDPDGSSVFCSECEKVVPKLDVSGDTFGTLLRNS